MDDSGVKSRLLITAGVGGGRRGSVEGRVVKILPAAIRQGEIVQLKSKNNITQSILPCFLRSKGWLLSIFNRQGWAVAAGGHVVVEKQPALRYLSATILPGDDREDDGE